MAGANQHPTQYRLLPVLGSKLTKLKDQSNLRIGVCDGVWVVYRPWQTRTSHLPHCSLAWTFLALAIFCLWPFVGLAGSNGCKGYLR